MEKSGNIEDQVMDHLLRSYHKQQRPSEQNCEGFDPDLASLYLERVLTEKETARYEIHLYQCSPCRNQIVALAHFAEQDLSLAFASPVKEQAAINPAVAGESRKAPQTGSDWFIPLKQFLGLLTIPRFALAAAAAIVLAISIPLVISQRADKSAGSSDKMASTNQPAADGSEGLVARTTPPQLSPESAPSADQRVKEQVSNSKTPAASSEGEARPASEPVVTGSSSASGGAGVATPAVEVSVGPEKKEADKSEATKVAETKPRTEEPVARASETPAVATAPQPAPRVADRRDLPRIDSEESLKLPKSDQDAASKTLKPGASDGSVATARTPAGRTIRPGDGSVKPPATSSDSGGRGLTDKSKSLRSESDVRKDRARASASRKVDNKTFWLIDDIWTDKDYRKEKELPTVPLTKGSDVYKEVLEKHSGLQKFFKGFAANEKIIVVYKGTVYRVVP